MMREVDFCDAEAVAALFAERSYKAVIHFAGLKVSRLVCTVQSDVDWYRIQRY